MRSIRHLAFMLVWLGLVWPAVARAADMVAVTTLGAPETLWAEAAPIANVMAAFRLIGPNFGGE